MVVPYAKNEGMNMVANLAIVITFCGQFKGQKYVCVDECHSPNLVIRSDMTRYLLAD